MTRTGSNIITLELDFTEQADLIRVFTCTNVELTKGLRIVVLTKLYLSYIIPLDISIIIILFVFYFQYKSQEVTIVIALPLNKCLKLGVFSSSSKEKSWAECHHC